MREEPLKMIHLITSWEDLEQVPHGDGSYLRADLFGNVHLNKLLTGHPKTAFSLRSVFEGGAFSGSIVDRQEALIKASETFEMIELEGERDLVPLVLNNIPPAKRIISWHGPACDYDTLAQRLERFRKVEAAYYQLVPYAERSGDELAPLALLRRDNSSNDLITYAAGPIGRWTQIVAAYMGTAMTYFVEEEMAGQAFFTYTQLRTDYELPAIYPIEQLFGIVGNPIFGSRSPRLHNYAYRQLGLPMLYLPIHVEAYADFWEMIRGRKVAAELGYSFGGFTTVSPMKEAAFYAADNCSNPHVLASNASNMLVKVEEQWEASSTDDFGLQIALAEAGVTIGGLKVAIIGCGGAGRTMAALLKANGASVTLVNRSLERGQFAAQQLGLPFVLKQAFSPDQYGLVVNATPLGKKAGELAFDPNRMPATGIVVDMSYAKHMTQIIKLARLRGMKAIDGQQMLRYQVSQQFLEMTGNQMIFDNANIIDHKLSPNQ